MNLENPWVQFGIHVFVGTMAGGLSDTVAVWMLFNPKKKRFGFQGAIPKNQARLAKSLGRTVGERLLTPGDLQSELARPELLAAFQSRVEDVIANMLTSRDPLIDKVPPAVVTALEGAMTAYLPVAMTKLGAFLGQPTTRVKLRNALHSMFNRFVDDMRFHERIFAKLMMTEKKFDTVLDAIETDGVEQVVGLLEEPEIREEISKAIHDAILSYLQKPISDILGDVEAKKGSGGAEETGGAGGAGYLGVGARSAAGADQEARCAGDGRAQSDGVQRRPRRGDPAQRDPERAQSDHHHRLRPRRTDRCLHLLPAEGGARLVKKFNLERHRCERTEA